MFGSGDAFYQHKNATPVRVEIAGAEPVEGLVFLAIGDRLSDLLNDARPFIPVRCADGAIVIVAKQHIVSIVERGAKPQELDVPSIDVAQKMPADDNPYFLLQVAPNAPMADIVASCRRLTEKLLPQNMAGANVKDPQIRSALSAAKKILDAYKLILRERGLDKQRGAHSAAPVGANNKPRGVAK